MGLWEWEKEIVGGGRGDAEKVDCSAMMKSRGKGVARDADRKWGDERKMGNPGGDRGWRIDGEGEEDDRTGKIKEVRGGAWQRTEDGGGKAADLAGEGEGDDGDGDGGGDDGGTAVRRRRRWRRSRRRLEDGGVAMTAQKNRGRGKHWRRSLITCIYNLNSYIN